MHGGDVNGRLAILCPGQGHQHAGMFDFFGTRDKTMQLLQAWSIDDRLGIPLEKLLADPDLAYRNRIAQPLILSATLAAWETLRDVLPPASLVAGYSVGELAAYAVAGSLSPVEALDLAVLRAGLMDDCAHSMRDGQRQAQGLLSVSGVATDWLDVVLKEHGAFTAIRTGPESAIVGGMRADLLSAAKALQGEGARACMLRVDVASHTPLMQQAVTPFLDALRRHAFADPAVPVIAGISGEVVRDADRGSELLARQLSEPIQWHACMRACVEGGIKAALELGPGGALSRMFRQQHPEVECRSVDDFRSVAGVAKWIERQLDS